MLDAGQLRTHVTFKAPTPVTTKGDTTLDPWTDDFQAFVDLQWLGSTEVQVPGQLQAVRTGIVTMRYDERAASRKRMVLDDASPPRTLEIIGCIDPDERKRELQLTVREIVQ